MYRLGLPEVLIYKTFFARISFLFNVEFLRHELTKSRSLFNAMRAFEVAHIDCRILVVSTVLVLLIIWVHFPQINAGKDPDLRRWGKSHKPKYGGNLFVC